MKELKALYFLTCWLRKQKKKKSGWIWKILPFHEHKLHGEICREEKHIEKCDSKDLLGMFRQVLRQSWNSVISGGKKKKTQTKCECAHLCGWSQSPVKSFNQLWIFQNVAAGGGQYWSSRRGGVIKCSRVNLRGKAAFFSFFPVQGMTSYHGNKTKETHLSACLSFCRTLLYLALFTPTARGCSSIYQPAVSQKHTHKTAKVGTSCRNPQTNPASELKQSHMTQ